MIGAVNWAVSCLPHLVSSLVEGLEDVTGDESGFYDVGGVLLGS